MGGALTGEFFNKMGTIGKLSGALLGSNHSSPMLSHKGKITMQEHERLNRNYFDQIAPDAMVKSLAEIQIEYRRNLKNKQSDPFASIFRQMKEQEPAEEQVEDDYGYFFRQ